MRLLFYAALGYLSGSVMFGYWIPKLVKNMDVTELSGDHNPGTANTFLHAGPVCGVMVLLCDILKGALPVYLAARHIPIQSVWFAFILIAPVLGHAFPAFSSFKNGGKCIAVSFGVLLGLWPVLTCLFLLAFWYLFFSLILVIRPAFSSFKNGGKCIAVSFGVLLGLWPVLTCLFLLAFWYLFFSLILVIRPHSLRTVVTFFCWALSQLLLKTMGSIVIASFCIAMIVTFKHIKELKKSEEKQIKFLFHRK